MNKIPLAKGVHQFSTGNLRVNWISVSFHVSYVRKKQSSVMWCGRWISWWESNEAVDSGESTFKILSWWLGLTKLKNGLKILDEDCWWPLSALNFVHQGEGDAFLRDSSRLDWTLGRMNDFHKCFSHCQVVKHVFNFHDKHEVCSVSRKSSSSFLPSFLPSTLVFLT